MLSILFFLISLSLILFSTPDALAITFAEPSIALYFLHILTHMFGHADWGHLIGNYVFLFPYGLYLEHKHGKKRFLYLWFVAGLSSLLLHRIMSGHIGGLIGASGAISGIMAAALLSMNENVFYKLAGIAVLSWRAYMEINNALFGLPWIAYWGHFGGIVAGCLVSALWFVQDGGVARIRSGISRSCALFRSEGLLGSARLASAWFVRQLRQTHKPGQD